MRLRDMLYVLRVRLAGPAVKRLLIGLPFILIIWWLVSLVFKTGNTVAAISMLVFGVVALGLFIGTNVAPALGRFFGRPLANMFFPTRRLKGPQPMYSIPAGKRARGLYEEAILGYTEIALKCPGEIKPYRELIDIAVMNLHDAERARMFFHQGLASLDKKEDKEALTDFFEATMTRLHKEPQWLEDHRQRDLVAPDHTNRPVQHEPDGRTRRRFHPGGHGTYRRDGDSTPNNPRPTSNSSS